MDLTVAGADLATQATSGFGGFLRCESCGAKRDLSQMHQYYATGWPEHCGYTMRWWTQRQVDADEVPVLA